MSEEKYEYDKLYQRNSKKSDTQLFENGNRLVQYAVGFAVCIGIVGLGTHRAWTSPSLPYLKNPNPYFIITNSQGTWIVSLLLVGDTIGSIIDPIFIDRLGRKKSIIIFTIPAIISWLLIIYAENYIYIYIARLLAGIHQGGTINVLIIYISEIAEKRIRGILGNLMRVASTFGYFICTALSAFLPFKIWNSICMLIHVTFFVISFFLPESPYFFFMKNHDENAVKTLVKLRQVNSSKELDLEIQEIKITIAEQKLSGKMALIQLLGNKQHWRDLIISSLMLVIQLFSGILAVNFYTEEILSYSDFSLEASYQVMIVTGITVVACAFTTFFIDRFERKTLFLYSGLLCSLSLAVIGIFFFMKFYLEINVSSIKWLPLLGLVMYKISYSLGMGPIPDILMGEIFPINIKATAISFIVVVTSIFCLITAAGYEILNKMAGIYVTFFVFSISAFLGPILIYFITPSTAGKTLEEIQLAKNRNIRERLESERLKCSNFLK
ncbi:facilitated trehalose transporter Tret1-like [Leptopilina boulardi]|uniref:facilitated trehalose transporter Tret1-like n=1 Tax=Leptopilina boulardi TaxID=63433 RepID=UPI0021F61ADF|nr:facilitated trehalose transporter Tret1-like [Leptopilina boulardi]